MLTEVRNNLNFILKNWKYTFLASFEYKKSFFAQIIFMIINNGFFLIFWQTVFAINDNQINGFSYKDILFMWAIVPAAYGVANIFFGGLNELNRYIINGELDAFCIQPKNIFLNVATSKCIVSAIGDLVYGVAVACFAISSIRELALYILFVFTGTVLFICTKTIIMMLGIWIGDAETIAHIYENNLLINFSSYPESIFKTWVRVIMYTVVPAAYMAHMPVSLINSFDIKMLGIVFISVVVYILLTVLIFKKGMKRYESGSGIGLRG
ncbi:MAG: ABC-2 family transporter protein [Clostridia bacterium]|nr:ABC-2 family transporter protein [Clostridia bacterium]